jgi:hypothetical protein
MQKFSFTVDVVAADGISVGAVREALARAVETTGDHRAVVFAGQTEISEHGMKVWAKRCAGISLAAPKPVRKPRVKKEEASAETVA